VLAACADVEHPTEPPAGEEVITTVRLTFTPASGAPLAFAWDDPEADGDPLVDPIVLPSGAAFRLAVGFVDRLAEPDADVTDEVRAESDQHQVFLTGSAVDGPAGTGTDAVLAWDYADRDRNGLPVGLDDDVTTAAPGVGTLIVTLRHLPPESGTPVKTGDLAAAVAAEGFAAIGGGTDAQVTFDLTVE
jgi:hypothetical protein